MSKKALITGISGQDGPYLSRLLIEKGYEVIGVRRPGTQLRDQGLRFLGIQDRVSLEVVDMTDVAQVIALLLKHLPDEIYNLGSQSSVGLSFKSPYETMSANILSVLNLLEAIRTVSPHTRFYQASSSEMFGRVPVESLPITESSIPAPSSPYAVSKTSAHWAAMNYREAYNVFVCSGILFNHESALRGQEFVTKKVISTVVRIARGEASELTVGNMNVSRDWGYAPAYVEAMWLMLQQSVPDDFIICSGKAHSLEDFVTTAFEAVGLRADKYLRQDPNLFRPVDLAIVYGDNRKAEDKLGWRYTIPWKDLVTRLVKEEGEFQDFCCLGDSKGA